VGLSHACCRLVGTIFKNTFQNLITAGLIIGKGRRYRPIGLERPYCDIPCIREARGGDGQGCSPDQVGVSGTNVILLYNLRNEKIGEENCDSGVYLIEASDRSDDEAETSVEKMNRLPTADQMFVHLVDTYLDRVYRYLCNLTRDDDTARDLSHETFINLRRQVDKGAEISEAYVFTAARNSALSNWRSNQREESKREAWGQQHDGQGSSTSSSVENRELRQALQAALGTLSEEHRTVFLLSEVEGLKYDQIAEVLDISPGTVASRKFKASRALRVQMGRMGHELP